MVGRLSGLSPFWETAVGQSLERGLVRLADVINKSSYHYFRFKPEFTGKNQEAFQALSVKVINTSASLLRLKRDHDVDADRLSFCINQVNELLVAERYKNWHTEGNKQEAIKRFEEARETNILDLSGLKLTSLPENIKEFVNVQKLNLSENQLTSIPKELGKLSQLTELDLSNNQLTSIPPELGNLSRLDGLYLSCNKLTSVPKELGKLSKLRFLHLHENELTSIPEELGNLSNLTHLLLDKNRLRSIPPELGNLQALKILNLDRNALTSIPTTINQLHRLISLRYRDNQIQSEPEITLGLTTHEDSGNPFSDNFGNTSSARERRAARERSAASITDDAVNGCLLLIGQAADASLEKDLNLTPLQPAMNGTLHLWLMRCMDSKEWKELGTRKEFAKGLLEIVNYAASNEEYRETFFNVLRDSSCSDRATLSYDTLKLNLEIARLGKAATMEEVIALFRRDFVAKQVDAFTYKLEPELKKREPLNGKPYDQISALLSLRQEVGRRLNIRIGSQNMIFVNLSYLKEEDYQKAKNQVEEALKNTDLVADHFVGHSAWKSYLDAKFGEEKDKALSSFFDDMEKANSFADVTEITEKQKAAEKAWYLTKTKELLISSAAI